MRFTGAVRCRPVRIGFLVPPDDLGLVSRVARLSMCLWGGCYNVIIPFFGANEERWFRYYQTEDDPNVARGYINFFEPDILIEPSPGMAERLSWKNTNRRLGLPRTLSLDQFYKQNLRGHAEFVAGVDILEVILHLYNNEYKYEQRHRRPFAVIDDVPRNAFFDVIGGRYPNDEILSAIPGAYTRVFSPETLPASADSALKIIKDGYAGPIWVTRQDLEESIGGRFSDQTFYVFDPTNAGDVIDYWNHRLIENRVIPINVAWFAEHKDFIRECILRMNRPIPGNPFGTKFHTDLIFSSSISDETALDLLIKNLDGLSDAFRWGRTPLIWQPIDRSYERREIKKLATSKSLSFDEEVDDDGYVRLPAPSPTFLNISRRYTKARWIDLITFSSSLNWEEHPATVYPSNLWSPEYPSLAPTGNLRIGREGWALQKENYIGYSLLRPQDGRGAIIEWLQTQGIEAQPSEEGQVAAQIIAAAGGLWASGMFADRNTIDLLNGMAEGSTKVIRDGRQVVQMIPLRSKHINTIRDHFAARAKRSFDSVSTLDYFLKRSVFRAGLRVKCPICTYHNWFDLEAVSYSPTCARCLNQFELSQSPKELHEIDWFYRVVGPFAAPDYARGSYSVALTLRFITMAHHAEVTWTTGIKLQSLNCEVDFVAWHRPGSLMDDEREEPLLVIGEAKSFGKNAISERVIDDLRKVANHFPGAIMIVSSLREIDDYTADELERLRVLALWGRREVYPGQPTNPLIVLTATELFAMNGIVEAWNDAGGSLHALAEQTQIRYLNLPGFWEAHSLAHQRRRLIRLIQTRGRR